MCRPAAVQQPAGGVGFFDRQRRRIAPAHAQIGGPLASDELIALYQSSRIAADTLVWLDLPLPLVMGRLLRRTVKRAVTREELWGTGNRETLSNAFLSRNARQARDYYQLPPMQIIEVGLPIQL